MQRDITPDVLRGFALLGILVVNIQFMALSSEEGARGEWAQGLANASAAWIISAVFAGKFYLLFSFLFGYSSSYIIKNDRTNRGRWIKRCLVLMGFGVLHFTFLWHGDIIFVYGLFGLLLLAFMFRSERTLKIWTRVIYSISVFFISLIGLSLLIAERLLPQERNDVVVESKLNEVLKDGTFLEAIGPRVELWAFGLVTGIFLQGGMAFAAFLLGLRLARSNFLADSFDEIQNSKMIRRGLFFGVPLQVVAASILVSNEQSAEPSEAIYLSSLFLGFISAPLLSMAYLGIIRKLVQAKPNAVSWMKSAGRMSLTVYISQSLVTSLIFGPWGLGLFQELETWAVLILAIGIWIGLVYISALWLRRFDQGPLERIMHTLTSAKNRGA